MGNTIAGRGAAPALLSAALLLALPVPAGAQSGFAGAAISVDVVRVPHQSTKSPSINDNDVSGSSRGWSLTGGGTIKKHAVLQGEFSHTGEISTDVPPTQYQPPCPTCGVSRSTVRYRSRQFAVLGGYTTGQQRRVSVSALGGVIYVGNTTRVVSTYTPALPVLPSLPSDSTYTQYAVGPVFGLDVPIVPVGHVQIVPQVRIYKLGAGDSYSGVQGPMVTTVSVGARWTF